MKPRVLIDIKRKSRLYSPRSIRNRVNLGFSKQIRIPLNSFLKSFFILTVFISFIFGIVAAPTGVFFGLDISRAAQNDEERKALEAQLSQLEKEITDNEAKIEQYKKQGNTLQSEIKKLEAKIAKINFQIKAIALDLKRLDQEINQAQAKISTTEQSIDQNRTNLSQILQTLYEKDSDGMIEILLKNPQLSDFFGDLNNLIAVQDNMRVVLEKIIELRNDLIDQKEALGLERVDTAALKTYQDAQRVNLEKTQNEKSDILKVTKGKESEYQKIVQEKKKTAAEIRKQIYKMLGGGELTFDEAYSLAKMAEKATGVRAALLLAVLDRESALGKNVGRCNYETAMHPRRDIPVFLEIIKELALEDNLKSGVIKVSCANADGAYGGAMGPAQFIPSTWQIYKQRVADLTGNNPASPWRNSDAFMATALYLKDAGAAGGTTSQERVAAAKYYAGSRWRSYLWTYGDRVIAQAQKFEEDISILNA